MVGLRRVFLDVYDTTNILEELRREAHIVVHCAFLRNTIVEHPGICEMLGAFGNINALHGDRLGQFDVRILDK